MTWALTYRCGSTCAHCYILGRGVDPELPLRAQRRVVLALARACQDMGRPGRLHFSGGDPLRVSGLLELIALARQSGLQVELSCDPENLSLTLAQELLELGVARLSFGLEVHLVREAQKMGRLHLPALADVLGWLSGSELTTRVHTAVWQDNAQLLPRLYREASALGAAEFSVGRWIPAPGAAPFDPLGAEAWRRALVQLLHARSATMASAETGALLVCEDPLFAVLLEEVGLLTEGLRERLRALGRAAGHRDLFLDPDGTLRLGAHARSPLGQLPGADLAQLLSHSGPLSRLNVASSFDRCAPCEHFEICGGDPEHAEQATGSLFGADPLCWHTPDAP